MEFTEKSNVFLKNVKLIVKKLEDITNENRFPQLKGCHKHIS